MATIKAVGRFTGDMMEVTCVDVDNELYFFFNRGKDPVMESIIRKILKERHLIAGTFVPDEESMLNALNVIQYHFFDDAPFSVEVEGDIGEIPYEDGMIY